MEVSEIISNLPNIVDKVELVYKDFTAFTKVNPVVGGMVGLWLLGVITYVFKTTPFRIWEFIKRYTTITITLSSANVSFYDLLDWLAANGKAKNSRTTRVSDGLWGCDNHAVSLGFGNHYFMHDFRAFKLNRTILSSNGGNKAKEEISITTYGFKQKSLIEFIKKTKPKTVIKRKVFTWDDNEWNFYQELNNRRLETILLKKGQKERIVKFIQEFQDERDWYIDNDIAYKTGIIFDGPPGTGKTSLVKAIAGHLKKDLCVLSCDGLYGSKFTKAINSLPKESILLLEDFDSIGATKDRKILDEQGGIPMMETSLSELLNGIDGIFNSDGRIIIATTNRLETLDKALVRKGRFDLTETLGYVDESVVLGFFKRFFPEYGLKTIQVPENISASQIENCFLTNKTDPDKVVEEVLSLK